MTEKDSYHALLATLRARVRGAGQTADYAPATEEQLRMTEERLCFALPSGLRALYTEIANGGDIFRDGYILYGGVGGCPSRQSVDGEATIDSLASNSGWRLDAHVEAALMRLPGVFVQCQGLPDRFVPIGDLGCGLSVELDGWSRRLYVAGCGQDVHSYLVAQGLPPLPGSENVYMTVISFFAASVEEWITRKLDEGWIADVPFVSKRELVPEIMGSVGA